LRQADLQGGQSGQNGIRRRLLGRGFQRRDSARNDGGQRLARTGNCTQARDEVIR
jgi:hypothetical protein